MLHMHIKYPTVHTYYTCSGSLDDQICSIRFWPLPLLPRYCYEHFPFSFYLNIIQLCSLNWPTLRTGRQASNVQCAIHLSNEIIVGSPHVLHSFRLEGGVCNGRTRENSWKAKWILLSAPLWWTRMHFDWRPPINSVEFSAPSKSFQKFDWNWKL